MDVALWKSDERKILRVIRHVCLSFLSRQLTAVFFFSQGVLDTEDSFLDRSDEFFNNLSMFRSVNEDECVHSGPAK